MSENEMMTLKEVVRLQEWMSANGHSPEEIIECIRYIASKPDVKEAKEKGSD